MKQSIEFRRADLNNAPFNYNRIIANQYSATNAVTTAKFSLVSFFPVTIFEFFKIIANMYFLLISALQLFTDLNPENSRYTTIGPLFGVMCLSLGKQAWEDRKRHLADREMNNRLIERLRSDGTLESIPWLELQVGDIIKVNDRQEFAADCIILASSEDEGRCFTETANLDGETNLKRRKTLNETSDLTGTRLPGEAAQDPVEHAKKVCALKGYVEFEQPNNRLYNFTGKMQLKVDNRHVAVPIFPENIILRGCLLRSCQYVFGLVVFTGPETKLMQNMRPAPIKSSHVYHTVNQCIWIIFLAQFCMMVSSSIQFSGFNDLYPSIWYLGSSEPIDIYDKILSLLTFLMLYANLVPISLYVSMDMVKFFQAKRIESDPCMSHNGFNARARTSDLNEELGQVEYVFSDKTGTLTCNIMEFRKCYINGQSYGFGTTEIGRAAALRLGQCEGDANDTKTAAMSDPVAAQVNYNPDIHFDDPRLIEDLNNGDVERSSAIDTFLTLLSGCHTVIPEKSEDGAVQYRAASPDEEALVKAAKCLGYDLKTSAPKMDIEVTHGRNVTTRRYEVMAVNEFTSTRKRMSNIVKFADGTYMLYAKGADNVILERSFVPDDVHDMNKALTSFASEGLRTLVCAQREIPPEEFNQWIREYNDAMESLEQRDEKLVAVAEKIERDLTIVGCTAIEDQLQQGVPTTIVKLAEAGIKLWVLTGDKEETAINIGFACGLINNDMNMVKITNATSKGEILKKITEIKSQPNVKNAIENNFKKIEMALVVDGASMFHIFDDNSEDISPDFLDICRICKSVVACRVSPSQKARIVSLVREGVRPEPITLAIGDGANDVNMIQTAHVGIGISGQEGVQAVNSSDYAIAQFRFLENLLLLHGANNYRNLSVTILYSFYKNIALVLSLYFFNDDNGQSGSTLYESMIKLGWNVFLSLPIVVLGIYDREVSDSAYLQYPILYHPGRLNKHLNRMKFLQYTINGIVHAALVYFVPMRLLGLRSWSEDGLSDGLLVIGTTLYTAMLTVMNLKVALLNKSWNRIATSIWWISFLGYFFFVTAYSYYSASNPFFQTAPTLVARPMFWLLNLLIPMSCIGLDIAVTYYYRLYFPYSAIVLREREQLQMKSTSSTRMFQQPNNRSKSYKTNPLHSGYAFNAPEGAPQKRRIWK